MYLNKCTVTNYKEVKSACLNNSSNISNNLCKGDLGTLIN
jgi:hypothetical protein